MSGVFLYFSYGSKLSSSDENKSPDIPTCLDIFFDPSFNISSTHEIAILLEGAMLSNAPD